MILNMWMLLLYLCPLFVHLILFNILKFPILQPLKMSPKMFMSLFLVLNQANSLIRGTICVHGESCKMG
ncbi:unnamed protein product [Hymenolepis diminuta]|uniref:Uncharacterized protein n=1 Tax=Hymenolepis diminuta TaxID=6216 RepID=A0A564YIU4_HYMDI|nr:unnamed protein product [Hymenolepis diminuta]